VCTVGTSAKLYTGVGDGIDHSRVRPSHGSAPAISPFVRVRHTFHKKTSTDRAMMNDPMVASRFQNSKPRPLG
jgi:hypothetical protein